MLEKETNPLSKSNEGEMLSRYQRAQSLMQGIFTKDIALNSTVFPIWIGDSDCFWKQWLNEVDYRASLFIFG